MNIIFWGASSGLVTGSCCRVITDRGKQILLDCGMFQGADAQEQQNERKFPFEVDEIDVVVLSHAHIDHSGLLPKLCKEGYKGAIICTPATAGLSELLLRDNAKIISREPLPLYGEDEVERCIQQFCSLPYNKEKKIDEELSIAFVDAGHVLGSAITVLTIDGKNLIYSGDIGKNGQRILKDPQPLSNGESLIMECTYGDRVHGRREEKEEKLMNVVNDTLAKQGNIIIPALAVERTQEIIYLLNKLMIENRIPKVPVFIDSPMAVKATKVFSQYPQCYDEEAKTIEQKDCDGILDFESLTFCETKEQSMKINEYHQGAIIIAANGMCQGGRIQHHLIHNIARKESTILFMGYQGRGTLGRKILDGQKRVNIKGRDLEVKANIESIEGFSAHGDREELLQWFSHFQQVPKQVFLVHGEDHSREGMEKVLQQQFGGTIILPELGKSYEIPWK